MKWRELLISWMVLFPGLGALAGTHSHFTIPGGDRVIINLFSGPEGSEDQDSIQLYDSLTVPARQPAFGRTISKKMQWKDALNLVLSKSAKGRVDGTLAVYRWPGVTIDSSRRELFVQWTGAAAESLYHKFKHSEGQAFEFKSYDGRLIIYSSPTRFQMQYSEFD